MSRLPSIHPGEILYQEFLLPRDITSDRLAEAIGVDARRIEAIVHAQRSITAETALLSHAFSEILQSSGWGCKISTTWSPQRTVFPKSWTW